MHNEMHETLWEMHRTQDQLIGQVDVLSQKVVEMHMMLAQMHGGQVSVKGSSPKQYKTATPIH